MDPKNSGMEQTNGKGMVSLQNAKKVTSALREMYPPDSDLWKWLDEENRRFPQMRLLASSGYADENFDAP